MRLTALALVFCPLPAFAVGGFDITPPTPSETTTVCEEGFVWDLATESCVLPEDSTNDDSARLNDVRELAYAGRYQTTLRVLESLENPETSLALTYYGFVYRKSGQVALGRSYYLQALQADPDNILARSYMGQGFVVSGEILLARAQLNEIRARGGAGTWAETALAQAIASGQAYDY